ncbi:uncharacterized protein V1513DRAFT_424724 [Lipomyces chichibuensis]|uniref:uncharacterized protein n=1 Tax=Lipomyces chichibuensis TaxID=1546026 RepID=UPI0033438999
MSVTKEGPPGRRLTVRRIQGVWVRAGLSVSQAVLLNGIKELQGKLRQTAAGTIKIMTPYMNLAPLLDLACARRGDDGEERFWKRRKLSKTFSALQQERLALVEYCLHVFNSVGVLAVDTDGPLLPDQVALPADLTREKFFQDFLFPFRSQFASVRDKSQMHGWQRRSL